MRERTGEELRQVASFTGAWIETSSRNPDADLQQVASFTGAWIETPRSIISGISLPSPPSRGRGLKHSLYGFKHETVSVASFTGAWIETPAGCSCQPVRASPPSRGRGLKLCLRRLVGLVLRRLLHGGVD
ncbi:hypothetical protein LDFHOB_01475 [Candidatus Electronema aureum]